jgi:molybdate/tungstate transport system substrate-binding protein
LAANLLLSGSVFSTHRRRIFAIETMRFITIRTPASIAMCLSLGAAAALSLTGCQTRQPAHPSIVVFNAGALALPLRQALDSLASHDSVEVSQESAGSVETVRKITELGKNPDVVALADTALFSLLLNGRMAGSITVLGSTRLVLAYTDRSRFAAEVDSSNWAEVMTRPGVQVGRSNPALDPAGYRALIAMQLAGKHYPIAGLTQRLERAAPAANMRPKSADLVALLQTGNLDYAWEYESVARRMGLRFVELPREVNLGDPSLAATYAEASIQIPAPHQQGKVIDSTIVIHGAPIVFGAGILASGQNRQAAEQFITYLRSVQGRAILSGQGLQ